MGFEFDTSTLISEDALQEGLADRPGTLAKRQHDAAVERVCRSFQTMKRDQPGARGPYQPDGEWASYLEERRACYDSLLAGDVRAAGEQLRNFWRNQLGPIVKEYARYDQLVDRDRERVDRFQTNVSRNFLIWKEIYNQPASVLEVPRVGNPWGYVIDGRLIVPKATRFHALASQVRGLARDVAHPLIAEIGGGYGGMPYYLLRDDPGSTYVDFDLPETLALASYYLLCCLPDRKILLYGEEELPAGEAAWKSYDAVLLPNYALPALPTRSVDVFVNTFSLSEVPRAALEEYVRQIERTVRGYFLHNNMDRPGVVNRGYERTPASSYPVDGDVLKLVYKHFDLFHGHHGDYREFLYERIAA